MRAFLGLGSNLGDRADYLRKAITALEGSAIKIEAASKIYETEPWGFMGQPAYLNQVIELETSLKPIELLHFCQKIEQLLGRKRERYWGPRTIDIDLLIYDNIVIRSEELILPHPYLEERAFVLIPLREIAPELVLPSGRAITEVSGEGEVHSLEQNKKPE